jgi:outer membrane protein OmpA-like peptidoglycan-associated protein
VGQIRTLILTATLSLTTATAWADGRSFDIEHLQLATGGGDFLATEGAGQVRPWEWRVGIAYRSSESPLVVDDGGTSTRLIASRSLLDLNGSVELGRWFGIGADLPLAIDGAGGVVQQGAALGDLRLIPRFDLLRGEHLGLAALLGVRLPTGDTTRFLGEGMIVFEPRVAAQLTFGMLRVGFNVGVRIREAREYLGLHVGDELFASLALAVVPKPWLDLFAELHGDTAMSSAFGTAQMSPVEALVGAAGTYHGVRLGAALGVGLVSGYGESSLRALLTLEYRRPAPKPVAAPPSFVAQRPRVPPATPPKASPAPAPAPAPVEEEAADDSEVAEVTTPTEEPHVSFVSGRIELAQPIFFELNRRRIRSTFHDELRELARVLLRRPELTCIMIEGHADQTGPKPWNLELSRARAAFVARFLVAQGVAAERLAPVGFGEARPMIPTPHGVPNEKNRRVHFYTDVTRPDAAAAPVATRAELK